MIHGLAQSLRALTAGSPITTAINEARRMARRHLEAGGAAVPPQRRLRPPGFVLPAGIDPVAITAAIEAELGRRGGRTSRHESASGLVERAADGHVVVPLVVLERLGGGDADRGARFLHHLVRSTRA